MRDWLRRFKRPSDAEFAAEIEAHLAHEVDEQIDRGVRPDEARYAALRRFGNVARHVERFREASPWFWLETVWADVRYGARGLGRSRTFTLTAVISLALGIGLNTAMFSAIDAMLLNALPYPDAHRIVQVDQTISTWGPGPIGMSPAVFDEWQQRARSFESMALYERWFTDAALRDGASVEHLEVTRVTSGIFEVLGVPPLLGRVLAPEDDRPGTRVAVLTHDVWAARWNKDPGIVGRDLVIDDAAYRVVGVMPPGFRFYKYPSADRRTWSDVFLSDPWLLRARTDRWSPTFGALGRLKDGVTIEQATSEIATLAATTTYGPPPDPSLASAKLGGVVTRWDIANPELPSRLWLVWGVSSLLLLLAVTTMANLVLARAGARRQELAIRAAIGGSRARVMRQLLTESLMLSLAGGMAGLVLAAWAGPLLETFIPDTAPMWRLHEAGVNWRVLAFMTGLAVLAAVLFGLAPAWRESRGGTGIRLLPSSRMTDSRCAVRTRTVLLVGQLAVSLVLLTGAGVMLATLSRVWERPLGFDPDRVVTFIVRVPRALPYVEDLGFRPMAETDAPPPPNAPQLRHWAPTSALRAVPERLVKRLRTVPGVTAATVATGLPMVQSYSAPFRLPNHPPPADRDTQRMVAIGARIVPGYFETLGMRMVAGRAISSADYAAGRRVAVVNEQMARTFWGHAPRAIGDTVAFVGGTIDEQRPLEIVGVVSDARFWVWDEPAAKIFSPLSAYASAPLPPFQLRATLQQNVAVRLAPGQAPDVESLRRAVADVVTGAPLERVRMMTEARTDASGNTPGITLLLSIAAGMALLLAAVGVFGMASYAVSQRAHEIGLRIALGASAAAIVRMVLAGAAWIAAAGVAVGWLGAFWLSRFIAGEVFPGSNPADPRVIGAVAAILAATVLLATSLPARRAAAVDPGVALRAD